MAGHALNVPVAFLIFRRPEQTARVFEAIRAARPKQLLIVADGPRASRPDDFPAVTQTRAIAERVDWDCEVFRNYAPQNMGCKPRVGSGLDWVFKQVEQAIILEDDCLPHPSFFPYCQELLERYRDDERIGWIAGTDLQLGRQITPDSYHFARNAHIWGWASWRRSWQTYDGDMRQWPALRESGWLKTLYDDPKQIAFWTAFFDQAHRGQTAWDVPWLFSNWAKGRFNAAPNTNLVTNIGFAADATGNLAGIHPIFRGLFADVPAREMKFPLRHPSEIKPKVEADDFSLQSICSLDPNYVRRAVAESWRAAEPKEFASRLHTDWSKTATSILNSGLRLLQPLTAEEHAFACSLIRSTGAFVTMSTDVREPLSLQELLAAMLYVRADQIAGLSLDVEKLPDWFQADFIKYLHEAPALFTERGDSERYVAFLERWIDTIWEHVQRDPITEPWSNAAIAFLQSANFIGVYFNRQNVKSLYEKRARLMEFVLGRLGHALDYTFPARSPDRQKIRLGILASHFAPQTETYTTLPAYKHLSRDRYEIILFAMHQNGHRMERFCAGHADTLIVLPTELPAQAKMLREADLDVLWIGTNVTAVTNWVTLLATHRLGRVQVTSTSSCVTTGMRNVDYYLSGSLCEPSDAATQYTERLLLMDGPAHCMDFGAEARPRATQKPARQDLKIGSDDVVMASGANFYKIIPEVQEAWVKILAAVPNARLLLYPFNPNWSNAYPIQAFVDRFKKALIEAGVAEDRLIVLAPAPSRADVLHRLSLADVYLDSFPFSGVNSLLDPLEVGLPPVVMEGNSFRSLMAPSLMRELEIPELIAPDVQTYISEAIRLANDSSSRADLARRIREGMKKRPRFIDSEWYSNEVDRLLTPILAERGIRA